MDGLVLRCSSNGHFEMIGESRRNRERDYRRALGFMPNAMRTKEPMATSVVRADDPEMTPTKKAGSRTSQRTIQLYSPPQILLASVFAPISGFLLLGQNWRRLEQPTEAVISIIAGLLLTVFLLINQVLPAHVAFLINIAVAFGIWFGAEEMQGRVVELEVMGGASVAPIWKVLVLGIACFFAVTIITAAVQAAI